MRILLAQPAPFEKGRLGLENMIWMSEPVALTAVAGAVIGEGHEVRILDMRIEEATVFTDTLRSFKPDIVGVTSMTTDCYQAKALLYSAKRWSQNVVTVIGGHHPTLSTEEFCDPFIDVIVRGEGEHTFAELVREVARAKSAGGAMDFSQIAGIVYREGNATQPVLCFRKTAARSQSTQLDSLPMPASHLVEHYRKHYFFMVAQPMASIFTSRGCSFDCNFCAIWEFYERRTRYLSAKKIVDQMERAKERFVFILDDNFLTNRRRLEELYEELRSRKVHKFWMTQGRTDFVAEYPELIAKLASVGFMGLLSGYETNDDEALVELRKKNNRDKNARAAEILRQNGIVSTGIFLARPEFDERDFGDLYDGINKLGVALPIVTILTPLPGTEMYRRRQNDLITDDLRMFDLLHCVTPTKLPRSEFYRHYARNGNATAPSLFQGLAPKVLARRWDFWLAAAKNYPRFAWRWWQYRTVHYDPQSFLRDEEGLLVRHEKHPPPPILPPGVPIPGQAPVVDAQNRLHLQVLP